MTKQKSDQFYSTINLKEEDKFKAFSFMSCPDCRERKYEHYVLYVSQTEEELKYSIENRSYQTKNGLDSSIMNQLLFLKRPLIKFYMKINDDDYLANGDIYKDKKESNILIFSVFVTAFYISFLSLD